MDPSDGRFDLTAGGDDDGTAGLLPLAIPGNEPTCGPNLLMALVYFHENTGATPPPGTPPSMTFGGAGISENDSWAATGGHYAVRDNGRKRYFSLAGAASINLGFYDPDLSTSWRADPLDFNLEGLLFVQSAEFRIGDSKQDRPALERGGLCGFRPRSATLR